VRCLRIEVNQQSARFVHASIIVCAVVPALAMRLGLAMVRT
jgi:hypothetical protein